MKYELKFTTLLSSIVFTSILVLSNPVNAADSVVLKYKFLRETVSVPELSTFAQTGELSSSLRAYLKLAGKEPDELRKALTQEIPVQGVLLSRILNNPIGEAMLDRVSEVVHTPSDRANRESLRSALVMSALDDDQITLIETLENYPTPEVHLEGDRLVEIVQDMAQVAGSLPNIDLF